MTPYETLGVPRDADGSAIKRAYRTKAKSVHPDHGGSSEKFGALAKAYGILNDPERRRRYDQTGDETETAADNSQAEVLATISMHLDRVVISALQKKWNLLENNLVEVLVQSLNEGAAECRQQQKNARDSVSEWTKLIGRFHVKQRNSVLDSLVQGKIRIQKQAVEEGARKLGVIEKALEIVKSEEFRSDKPPEGVGWGFPRSRFMGDPLYTPDVAKMFGKWG